MNRDEWPTSWATSTTTICCSLWQPLAEDSKQQFEKDSSCCQNVSENLVSYLRSLRILMFNFNVYVNRWAYWRRSNCSLVWCWQCLEWWLRLAKPLSMWWLVCMVCRRRLELESVCSSSSSCSWLDWLFFCLTSCCRKVMDLALESRCLLQPTSVRQLSGRHSVRQQSTLVAVCCSAASIYSNYGSDLSTVFPV